MLINHFQNSKPLPLEIERLTITKYTKHYYIDSERVASALGHTKHVGMLCEQSGFPEPDIITRMNEKVNFASEILETTYAAFDKDITLPQPFYYETRMILACDVSPIPDAYAPFWYHPDHLGSSSYITNLAGEINQHIEYLPFGELLVEEHLNSYNSPFKFNAKEFDAETGNYYYGARYYNPKWSTFLTPDPALESYPGISPYAYTLNNPIKYVDPTGMYVEDSSGGCDCPPNCYDPVVYNKDTGIKMDPVVITGERSDDGSINLQNRYSGSMDDWQELTKGVFSTDHELADLQWKISYGNADQEYFQAQLDEQTAAQHRATDKAAELIMYILPTPLAGGTILSKAPTLYRSAKVASTTFDDILRFGAIYGDYIVHQRKVNAINHSYKVYSSLSPGIRRTVFPIQKSLIREKTIFRDIITTENFEIFSRLKKYRGGI